MKHFIVYSQHRNIYFHKLLLIMNIQIQNIDKFKLTIDSIFKML